VKPFWVGLACAAAILGSSPPSSAADTALVLDVAIDTRGPAQGPDMRLARAVAAEIYAAAGIRLNWSERRAFDRLTVVVVAGDRRADLLFGTRRVLGRIAQGGVRAYVHYDRIAQFARDNHAEPGRILGAVIAHEIGHLVLGEGHSATGVMAPAMDPRPFVRHGFTPEEGLALRTALSPAATHVVFK
jgi:hypothetical protein